MTVTGVLSLGRGGGCNKNECGSRRLGGASRLAVF